jgi:putative ABC transport system substrate-binding protein
VNNRRKLVIALGAGALVAPLGSFAQTPKIPRIGILYGSSKSDPKLQEFMQELLALGYVDGQNVSILSRFAGGQLERLPALAAELVAEKVDVIFANATPNAQAARPVAGSIPIVFAVISDPVGQGFVNSLARPGGNITGLSSMNRDLAAKRLQILKEIVPKTSHVVVLTTDEPQVGPQLEQVQRAAKRLGMNILTTQVLSRDDFGEAKKLLRSSPRPSIYVPDSSTNYINRKLLIEFAAEHRLPAIYAQNQFADDGGLISYGANQGELFRRAAHYVDKILKGAKPANMPVEQPTKFDLVVNVKTAKALGIKIPQSILVQATKVIE